MAEYRPKIGKQDIAKAIQEKHNLPYYRAEKIVRDVMEEMFQALSMGIPVTITNLGSLKPFEDKGRVMYVCTPGKEPEVRRQNEDDPTLNVAFMISPRLRDAMNKSDARQTIYKYPSGRAAPRKLGPVRKKKGRKSNG